MINKDVRRFRCLSLARHSSSVFILQLRRARQFSLGQVRLGMALFGYPPHLREVDSVPKRDASKPQWTPGHGTRTWTKKRSSAPMARV